MDSKIVAIILVNASVGLLAGLSSRIFPEFRNKQSQGLYVILLPLGFGLFGWELSYRFTAPLICVGLVMLLVAFRGLLKEKR